MGKPKNTIWNVLSQVDPEGGIESCWCWTGGKHQDGYGVIRYNGKRHKAHRLMYEHFCHELNSSKVVRHVCDNPACCNPTHLLEGTQADNIRDMYERNRDRQGVNPYKLSKEQIKKIYELRKRKMNYSQISKEVNCSIATAHRYATGKVV